MLLAMHRIGRRGTERTPIDVRFWEKVDKTPTCWLWTGSTDTSGYGSFWNGEYRSTGQGRPVMVGAHIWAHETFVGPRGGLAVLHRCDTPRCVNYERCLFLGTKGDNNRDRAKKGRSARGGTHPKASMSEETAIEILRLYRAGGVTQQQLADQFSVGRGAVGFLVTGRRWKHLHSS